MTINELNKLNEKITTSPLAAFADGTLHQLFAGILDYLGTLETGKLSKKDLIEMLNLKMPATKHANDGELEYMRRLSESDKPEAIIPLDKLPDLISKSTQNERREEKRFDPNKTRKEQLRIVKETIEQGYKDNLGAREGEIMLEGLKVIYKAAKDLSVKYKMQPTYELVRIILLERRNNVFNDIDKLLGEIKNTY